MIIEVDHGPSERADADCSAALVAGPIVHIADVDHPSTGELIIATDLAATGEAGTVRRHFPTRERRIGVTKGPANVAADVAGPGHRSGAGGM